MGGFRGLGVRTIVFTGLVAAASGAMADTAYLADGSRLNGQVKSMSGDALVLATGFAGEVSIARDQLSGLTTEGAVPTAMASGDREAVRFVYEPGSHQQTLESDSLGVVVQPVDSPFASIGRVAPDVVAANQQAADDEPVLPDANNLPPPGADYWSGSFELGLSGNSGNTETKSLETTVSALRDTGDMRLSLSASVDKQSEDNEDTAEEYLGEGRYESDFTDRAFWFVQQGLEKDQFENIDLRSRTLVGPGYFLARQDKLTFKVRSGVGYQHEIYTDDGNNGEMIFSAGWDYAQIVGDWLKLSHEFTAYPEVTNDPGENYTLESALAAEIPLANSDLWSIRGALKHEYNNNPQPGVEDLDTSYEIGVVRDF